MQIPDSSQAAAMPFSQFFSSEFMADPFPMLAMLRAGAPIFRLDLPGGRAMWLITRFEDAIRILKDPRISSNTYNLFASGGRRDSGRDAEDGYGDSLRIDETMVFTDEPDHTRLRALVSRGFTPRLIESLRPRIEALAGGLIDQVQANGRMDLMADFAYPLPINVISEMLGVPTADQDKIRDWSAALGDQFSEIPDRAKKLRDFAAYVRWLIAEKRRSPADDLISSLVQKGEDPDQLSERELIGMVSLLIFAGHETTSNLIGNGMLALFTHPDQLARLKADLSRIPDAVEELLRFCGPALATGMRVAREDVEFGGQVIRKGESINVIIGAGDRDPAAFTDPEDLDIARKIDRHLAFGHGIHYCLGAPLARLEGEIAFRALFTRLPNLRLDGDPAEIRWRGNMVIRGISALPVRF